MSTHPTDAAPTARKPVTLPALLEMRTRGEPITMLTCYDASFARVLDDAGVDTVLVGDSLGMVVQGRASTLAVTVAEVAYHTTCVARGLRASWLIADMPFGSYATPEQAFANAVTLMQAGAQMVKLEGGALVAPIIAFLVERGIPVCAHVGLTPQSVHALGGYRIQGKTDAQAAQLLADARALEDAGAALLVLELVPAAVATQVSQALERTATIGIGAGAQCHGQVLVLHDMLDVYPGRKPRFVRNFMAEGGSIADAVHRYVRAVKDRSFPAPEHCY
jgi:3-methyl-2-oxobutanoate hydroxymethyltransferase